VFSYCACLHSLRAARIIRMDTVAASLNSRHCHRKGWATLWIAILVFCSVGPIASSARRKTKDCASDHEGCADASSYLQLGHQRLILENLSESKAITSTGILAFGLLVIILVAGLFCCLPALLQQPSLPNEKTPIHPAQSTTHTTGTSVENGRPWLVLACFSFHAFCNQFMYMNFASATHVAEAAFQVDDDAINWLYSASLLGAVPSFLCVMAFSTNYRWVTTLTGIAFTVAAAWLRYLSMLQKSLPLAILSSVAIGPGTGLIFVGFAELPVLLFPQGRNQQICTGVIVQISFFGWALGALLSSLVGKSFSALSSFFLVQALFVSIALPVFFCWGHQLPSDPQASLCNEAADSSGDATTTGASNSEQVSRQTSTASLDIKESAMAMLFNWRFQLQALGMALLQAVGYAVPAVQVEVFTSKGYDRPELATSGFFFIMAGVALGMLLAGPLALAPGKESAPVVRRLILSLFWTAAVAVFMLQLCVAQLSDYLAGVSHQFEHIVYFCLMLISGACSLGFLNVTLPVVCAAAHPVPETYSGGITQLSSFALGALLTQLSTGSQFKVCTLASLGAAILMTAGICSETAPASSLLEEEPAVCRPASTG